MGQAAVKRGPKQGYDKVINHPRSPELRGSRYTDRPFENRGSPGQTRTAGRPTENLPSSGETSASLGKQRGQGMSHPLPTLGIGGRGCDPEDQEWHSGVA